MRYYTTHLDILYILDIDLHQYGILELIRLSEYKGNFSQLSADKIAKKLRISESKVKRHFKILKSEGLLFIRGHNKMTATKYKNAVAKCQNDTFKKSRAEYQNDTLQSIKMTLSEYQNDTPNNNKEIIKNRRKVEETTTTDFAQKNIEDLKHQLTIEKITEKEKNSAKKENVNPALASAETTRKIAEWLATDIGQNQMAVLQKTIAHNYTPSQIKQIIFNWANYRCKDNPNFYKKAEFDLWQNLSKWIASEYSSKYQQPRKNPKKSNRRGYSQDDMYAAAAAELAKIQGK